MPTVEDNAQFVTLLYRNMLMMDEEETGEGHKNWMTQLRSGATRESVYKFFVDTARAENQKNNKIEFSSLIDMTRPNKRGVLVIKESIGDCFMMTALFESFHEQYPDHDLYVITDQKYFDVFDGNPYVYKVLPYVGQAEHEMIMMGAGSKDCYFDVYFHPAIQTQRQLSYLSNTNSLGVQ